MRIAAAFAVLVPVALATVLPASANLTPLHQVPFEQIDPEPSDTTTSAGLRERDYFQESQQPAAAPARPVVPACTVKMVVFEKIRLAQACY